MRRDRLEEELNNNLKNGKNKKNNFFRNLVRKGKKGKRKHGQDKDKMQEERTSRVPLLDLAEGRYPQIPKSQPKGARDPRLAKPRRKTITKS